MSVHNPLYERIYEDLLVRIESGELAVGTRMPTEAQISQDFGVSRITVKKALEMLANKGYITRTPRRGTFVTDPRSGTLLSNPIRVSVPTLSKETLVGVVLPEFGDTFGLDLLSGIERTAKEHGAFIALARSYGQQQEEEAAILRLIQLGVKGLIVSPINGERYNPCVVRLHFEGFPIVLVDKGLPGIPVPAVTSTNREAALELTAHLLGNGHRNVAFFSPVIKGTMTLEERYEGFILALQQYGVPMLPDCSLTEFPTDVPSAEDSGYSTKHMDMIVDYIRAHPDLTGIFAAEYQVAAHVLRAAQSLGIRVPEDLSIVCFDSLRTNLRDWNFTHIRQNETAIGKTATEWLLQIIRKESSLSPTIVRVPGSLTKGQSVAAPKRGMNERWMSI